MNGYIKKLFRILTDVSEAQGISEFDITVTDNVLEIRRCGSDMFLTVLEFVKKFRLAAELKDGVIRIECGES